MTTAAQRDKMVTAAERKRDAAAAKLARAQAEVDEQTAAVEASTRRISWLQEMPVDDEPAPAEGSGEMTRALDAVDGGGSIDQRV